MGYDNPKAVEIKYFRCARLVVQVMDMLELVDGWKKRFKWFDWRVIPSIFINLDWMERRRKPTRRKKNTSKK